MKILKLCALGVVSLGLVGCGAHPDTSLSRTETDKLVIDTRQGALSGVQGLLVNTDDPWLGARAHKRVNGYPLPNHIRHKNISFQGYRSPTLSAVEVIRVVTEGLGLEYEIDTSSFYLGQQQAGLASSILSNTAPRSDQSETDVANLDVVPTASIGEDAGGGSASSEFCSGAPLRYAAQNEGIVAFARDRGTVAVSQLLEQGTQLSAGEIALNNILTGGLRRDLTLDGTPKEVFDHIVDEFNLGDWEYSPRDGKRGKITFKYYVSQEFKVSLRPPAENVAGANNFPEILDIWSDMRNRLAKSIGSDGEVSVYCDRSLVAVKTKPEEMRFVQDWLQNFSRQALQTVHVEVDIYQVTSDAADGFKIDLASFTDNLDGDIPYLEFISGGSRIPLNPNDLLPSAVADGAVEGATDTATAFTGGGLGNGRGLSGLVVGKDASATIVADLIATAGNSSLQYSQSTSMFSGSSKTLDFRTTQNVDVGTETNFVGDDASSQQATEITEDLVTGIVLDIQSVILQDGQVLIAYNMEISNSRPGAEDSVVNFETSVSKVTDELVIEAGQQVVQTASQVSNRRRSQSGIGDPTFAIFGGQDTRSETLSTFVVVLRPSIIRPNF